MKKLILAIFIVFFLPGTDYAQNIGIVVGFNYGGPLPTKIMDSTSGKPIPGLMAGVAYSIPISEYFSFSPALYYSFRGTEYSQSFTRDTTVAIVINNVSGKVPSFYTAYVNGAIRLHYLDIPLLFSFSIKKTRLLLGPYFSAKIAGNDAGNVRVVIGKGGFFDDYNETYNNFKIIRKVEQGLMFGGNSPIYKNLCFEIRVSRSFFSLYQPNKLPDKGQDNVGMFNTFVHVGLVYNIKCLNE